MKLNKTIIYLILILIVTTALIMTYPFSFRLSEVNKNTYEQIWNPMFFSNNKDVEEKPSSSKESRSHIMYRGLIDRNAVFNIDYLPKNFRQVWKIDQINFGIHGASKSSVIGDGERLYVGSDTSVFYCLSAKTGEIIWSFNFADSERGIHSTAALDENFVYIGTYRGSIYKINKRTGRLAWMRIVGETIGASVALFEDTVVADVETLEPSGYLIKLDKATGNTIWISQKFGAHSHSSPAYDRNSDSWITGANNKKLFSISNSDGKTNWVVELPGEMKSTVWMNNNFAIGTTWGGSTISFAPETGKMNWKFSFQRSQVSVAYSKEHDVVLTADTSYSMFGLRGSDGKLLWSYKGNKLGQMSSAVTLKTPKGDRFLFVCEERKLCLIHPKGQIEKKWDLAGHFTGSPYIENNVVYLAYNDGGVEAILLDR